MVKVDPLVKPELGSFTRFIKILSTLYLLPIHVDTTKLKVKFSFFSLKTLIHVSLVSLPFILLILWNIVLHPEDASRVQAGFNKAFEPGDLVVMLFYPGLQLVPLGCLKFVFSLSNMIANLPDVVFDNQLKLPASYKINIFIVVSQIIGFCFVFLGNYFAVGPYTSMSSLDNFVNIFLVFFIPTTFISLIIMCLLFINFSLMENVEFKMRSVPQENVVAWAKKNINLFRRFQECSNITIFGFIVFR